MKVNKISLANYLNSSTTPGGTASRILPLQEEHCDSFMGQNTTITAYWAHSWPRKCLTRWDSSTWESKASWSKTSWWGSGRSHKKGKRKGVRQRQCCWMAGEWWGEPDFAVKTQPEWGGETVGQQGNTGVASCNAGAFHGSPWTKRNTRSWQKKPPPFLPPG